MNLLSLLNGDNFGFFNREIAHLIGLHEAIIFSELVSKHQHFEKDLITIGGEEGFFYCTFEDLFSRTALKRKPQDAAIKELVRLGWITKINYGLPMKRYFKIHEEKIFEIASIQKKFSKLPKRDKLGCPKGTNLGDQKGQPVLYREDISKEETTANHPESTAIAPIVAAFFDKYKFSKKMQKDLTDLNTEEDLLSAIAHFEKNEDEIDQPIGWFKSCLDLRFWMDENASKSPEDRIKEVEEWLESSGRKEALKQAENTGQVILGYNYVEFRGMSNGYIKWDQKGAKRDIERCMDVLGYSFS